MDAICSTVGASPWRSFTIAWISLQRVLAVEERHHVEERHGQGHDLIGEAARIPQGDEPLAILLDRERLQVAEPGAILGHGSRTRYASR